MDRRIYAWRGTYTAPTQFSPWGAASLKGLRLGVKDLFHIAGLPTGAGNPDWLASHPIPTQTSPVVARLLSAGAELIAKTQTDELAYSLNGVNMHYGAPLNPKSPDRLPGGSSSGSAVAVAAGEIDIGLGTDTGGSIRVPASYNGLFGIRTSHGILSREQMVPLAPGFDCVGWLARSADTLLQIGDALLPPALVSWGGDRPLQIGVIAPLINRRKLWGKAQDQWLKQQKSLHEYKRLELRESFFKRASDCFRVLQGRDIWRTHGAWILQQQPVFAPDIQGRLEWASQLTQKQEDAATLARIELQCEIAEWFAGVDLLVLPTTPGPAPLLGASAEELDKYRSQLLGLTAPAGLAGLPQIHLPVLVSEGAPMGISLLGRKGLDRDLLRLAAALDYPQHDSAGGATGQAL